MNENNPLEKYYFLTVSEFKDEMKRIEEQAMQIDLLNSQTITPDELQTIKEYVAAKQLLHDINKAQIFIADSMQELSNGKTIYTGCVMKEDKYKSALNAFTNGEDNDFLRTCCMSVSGPEYLKEYRHLLLKYKNNDTHIYHLYTKDVVTVKMLYDNLNMIEAEKDRMVFELKKYCGTDWDKESFSEKPKLMEAMTELNEKGMLYTLHCTEIEKLKDCSNEYIKDAYNQAKQGTAEKPVIICTGGGYAIRPYVETGKSNTQAVEDLIASELTADNEYMPSVTNPIESTNDASRAGGDVAYTTVQIGSIEKREKEIKRPESKYTLEIDY